MPESKYATLCLDCILPDGCNDRALFCLVRIAKAEDSKAKHRQAYRKKRGERIEARRKTQSINTDTLRVVEATKAYAEAILEAGGSY